EGSAVAAYFETTRAVRTLGDKLRWIAQQFPFGNVVRKFRAQETFVGSVLEQTTNKISHTGEQLADRTVFANAITHFDQRAFHRPGHAVEQLKFETAAIDPELIG